MPARRLRIHFIPAAGAEIGNIYTADFEACLQERPCPRAACDCHIGYVHLEELNLDSVFGNGILERIPAYVSAIGR